MTLQLKQVGKTYPDGTQALLPTDLQVNEGEIISLLGPSGCGKTTLLRLIAGLERADSGSQIYFDHDEVTKLIVERRKIGMVFQSYALFPNMSVRDNIGYGLKMQKLAKTEIKDRVDHVLKLCQLTNFADRSIAALSGGQRQRVALARAVAPRPRILLLDEPLSALDAALRDKLRDELAILLREFGITAVFVTHDQDEAMAIADRVIVMSNGQVEQMGTPEEIYRRPKTPFVANFVGHAMSLGQVDKAGLLRCGDGALQLDEQARLKQAFVRAEDVKLSTDGAFTASVKTVNFLGTHYRVGLSDMTDELLYAQHVADSSPEIGQQVRVTINPRALMLLD